MAGGPGAVAGEGWGCPKKAERRGGGDAHEPDLGQGLTMTLKGQRDKIGQKAALEGAYHTEPGR